MARNTRHLVHPRRQTSADGRWRIPQTLTLAGSSSADRLGLTKTADLLAAAGKTATIVIGDDAAAAVRVVRSQKVADAEGYRLRITAKGVTVEASTDAGAFYGLATLREMIRDHGASLPCVLINDAPAFARRGVYHDCARGKVPKLATLKGLVDRLAEWKINELQLYVENAFAFKKHPLISKGYSPLTAADITSLQTYCRARHMRLVPSLSSFGHMEKVLAIPEYAHLGELPNGSTLCPTDPGGIRFVEDLYSEFLPLFEAEDFNVCCDETRDLGRGRTAALCGKIGAGRVYLDFLKKIHKLCDKFGKRMNAWADIVLDHPELLGEMPRDVVMLNWGYEADCERIGRTGEIAKAGLPLMVCPGTSGWGTIGSRWPNAWANIRQAATEGKKHGAEGLLNTDWGDRGHRQFLAVSMMAFAFGAAESWNPGKADPAKFPRVFSRQAFGDTTGELGDAIAAVGSTYLLSGHGRSNADAMAFNLDEPLRTDKTLWCSRQRTVDRYRPECIQAVLASLPEEDVWRRPAADEFDAISLAEYAQSARIVMLYCLRSSIAWQMGMGEKVRPRAMNDLADCIDRVGEDFAGLWRARNKPSRLCDNMRLFSRAAAEARKIARG